LSCATKAIFLSRPIGIFTAFMHASCGRQLAVQLAC
jgi:hypothetical protein